MFDIRCSIPDVRYPMFGIRCWISDIQFLALSPPLVPRLLYRLFVFGFCRWQVGVKVAGFAPRIAALESVLYMIIDRIKDLPKPPDAAGRKEAAQVRYWQGGGDGYCTHCYWWWYWWCATEIDRMLQ